MKLTDKAVAKALTMRPDDSSLLRVAVRGGGCAGLLYELSFIKADEKLETDEAILYGDLTVVVDFRSALYLQNTELDYVDGLNASGFKFTNPDASGTCGCGSSFGCP